MDLQNRDTSVASSSTALTSLTDQGSVSSNAYADDETPVNKARRVQRPRRSIPSYNENALSGTARRPASRKRNEHTAQKETEYSELLASEESESQPLFDTIRVLGPGQFTDSASPDPPLSDPTFPSSKRDSATNAESSRRTSTPDGRIKPVLGKRTRELVEAGRQHVDRMSKVSRLRPRGPAVPSPDTSKSAKKARFVEDDEKSKPAELSRKPIPEPKKKRWLSQGLYVGQDPDFDPRFTDAKNRLKKLSKAAPSSQTRKMLPMPMFAGKRLLEQGRDFCLPWDVFSPLPPGQPKPEEWRKVQKSTPLLHVLCLVLMMPSTDVFVGDAADIWKTSKKLEHSLCVCEPESGCDENCFNRFMFYECDDSNCNIGADHCTNRSFEDLRKRCKAGGKYNIGVEVIKTADRGYGVRSNRTFEPHQVIVEYTGEIITQDECDDRMRKMYKNNEVSVRCRHSSAS